MPEDTQMEIELSPPVNNIRRIELTPVGRAVLTLRNGKSLSIAIRDADRYGIAHLFEERK